MRHDGGDFPQPSTAVTAIAYFSMEFALEDAMPTYSGGLGVLAGDMMRSAADLGVPLVGVTLASRAGYFRQEIAGGSQVEREQPWDPSVHAQRLPCTVVVTIGGREVWIGGWRYEVRSPHRPAAGVHVLLLDTDLPQNDPDDRTLTHWLYGGDADYRLRQEIVLGVGGVRMLGALGVQVHKYHLNEGHSALLTLELLRELGAAHAAGGRLHEAVARIRARCVFTTHTPVEAGHDQFSYPAAQQALSGLVDAQVLHAVAGGERLNLTRLALHMCGWVNGVADRHARTSRLMFPGHEIHAITNGVHAPTWTAPPVQALFDRHVPHWRHEPELLVRVLGVADAELAAAHAEAKADLLLALRDLPGGDALQAQRLTIGFARRMTDYKRPGLLFSDPARLRQLAARQPLQIVAAGKAHPRDAQGKAHIEQLHRVARELAGAVPVVFVPDYRVAIAQRLVAGVDLWVNTPLPPLEASGTSGMKAALNGVPSLSVLDGWWIEGWEEGVTGWAIGSDGEHDAAAHAASLYDKLEHTVLPAWAAGGGAWLQVMKGAIARNGSYFNSHRMLRRYASEAYWR